MSTPHSPNRARVIDTLILVAIVVGVLGVVLSRADSDLDALVGKPAPQFKLRTMSGVVTGPPDHAGRVILLDFWATWCDPCFRQMPILERVLLERPDVVLLPINVDDPGPTRLVAMERFIRDAGLSADSLVDDGAVQSMYRVDTIPALVLIAPDGTIAYASSGVHSASDLEKRIDKISQGQQ